MRLFATIALALLSVPTLQAQKIGQKVKNQLFLQALIAECPECADKKGRLTQKAAEIDSLSLDLAALTLDGWDFTQYKHRSPIHLEAFSKLKTLKFRHYQPLNIRSWPPNLEQLDLSNTDLYEPLPTLPPTLKKLICTDFNPEVQNNEFDKRRFFDYPLPQGLEYVEAEHLGLKELPSQLPASVKELRLAGNKIESIDSLPAGLEYLNLDDNRLKNFPTDWPASLRSLSLRSNRVIALPSDWGNARIERIDLSLVVKNAKPAPPPSYLLQLPPSLKELKLSDSELSELSGELPAGLERLELSNNGLKKIPTLPPNLRYLDVSDNALNSLPELPQGLEMLNFSNNPIQNSPTIPSTLQEINSQHYEKP